ncbi:hypothetical protein JCM3775_005488 [Rhodotorula graminis]|uniref:Uncharacterized protein n=1 Tax=Rhodotorula graminis (strain WP1) TaxID=578459 RepID=A0A194S3I8_RHOGW|nr:uncharacterized protein RHOBADRAFT_53175 [Rhodotorula graminis WP1]KPV75157.1 hypothetical protein RHOBADRAFT_53175 [Rhodotorula graminis WP1]
MDDTTSSSGTTGPESVAPTTLNDLPDEVLCRIFNLVQRDEPVFFGRQFEDSELVPPLPVLARYRGLSRRLHYRILVPQARRNLVVPSAVAVPDGAAWDADVDPRVAEILSGTRDVVASLVLVVPPFRPRRWIPGLVASLVNLSDLTINGGIIVTRGLCAALRELKSLRKLSLEVDPDKARNLVDPPEKINLERDVPGLTHLIISFATMPLSHERLMWVSNGATKIRFLDIDDAVSPRVNFKHLEVLVLRSGLTSDHGAGDRLAAILEAARELPEWRYSSPFALKKLVIDVAYAEFDLYTGWNSIDHVLENLKHAPSAEALEVRFSDLFRCDGADLYTAVPTIKRLSIVETDMPSDGRQSANINGLEDFLDVFPNLNSFSLTSHWFLPATDAADLHADPDPPTDLSLAYDAPLLAELVMYVRDETPIKEFRYRRSESERWELRWTRSGELGTQFALSRWWL